jgi:hypothetical protein
METRRAGIATSCGGIVANLPVIAAKSRKNVAIPATSFAIPRRNFVILRGIVANRAGIGSVPVKTTAIPLGIAGAPEGIVILPTEIGSDPSPGELRSARSSDSPVLSPARFALGFGVLSSAKE